MVMPLMLLAWAVTMTVAWLRAMERAEDAERAADFMRESRDTFRREALRGAQAHVRGQVAQFAARKES